MNKKTILIFVDWYVPGYKAGGPIKSVYSMVQYLKHQFNFLIVTSNTDFNDALPYSSVEWDRWIKQEESVSVFYASKDYLNRHNIRAFLTTLSYEVIYLNSFFSVYFSLYPLLYHRLGTIKKPLILAPRGMLGKGALRLKWLKKKMFLTIFKLAKVHKRIIWHATSEQEKQECLENFGNEINVVVVPNLQFRDRKTLPRMLSKETDTLKLLFLSRISEKKNLLFALQVLLKIPISKKQQVTLDVYGPTEDEAYWQKCRRCINELRSKGYSIEYKGAVKSEEVHMVLEQYHLLFLPTLNENYGHVIVESFFAGRPVIISDQTPWNHLQAQNVGWDIDLNNIGKFESVIRECISMPNERYEKMIADCISYADKFCNSEKNTEAVKQMFDVAMNHA